MSDYKVTIGLEVHAELKTVTKLFCNSRNDPDEKRPNVNICPVCMGYPGSLPVMNRKAVEHVLRIGVAVGATLADYTEFDRKNYFYPDIPKGYQISQYKYPLVSGGVLGGVALERVHLEEDTARSSHIPSNNGEAEHSLIDFNRAGVPLMELVTKPVLHSAAEAGAFARELQLLLRTLSVGDANLEKGEMRVEANISVSNSEKLGTKVEVKNLNSFRSVERAIAYEIQRQSGLLDAGTPVVQETRGWDESKQQTFAQRLKEESHDYRYFPDPDVTKLKISEIEALRYESLVSTIPELPWVRRARYEAAFGLKKTDAEIFLQNEALGCLFESVAKLLPEPTSVQTAANYITSDLIGLLKTSSDHESVVARVTAQNLAALVRMIEDGTLSSRGAKDVLAEMAKEGGETESLARALGVMQEHDIATLEGLVAAVVGEHPDVVSEYKAGKITALQYLVGKGMQASRGSANPELLKKLFEKHLKSP